MKVLVLGAGNLLLSDEGFGVHVIRYLAQHYVFSEAIELYDAGTLGIMATHKLEDADVVYLIDVVLAEGAPGTVLRYDKEDFMLSRVPVKLSPHQAGVQEMLLVSELRGRCPSEIYLLGVIPVSIEPGVSLSPLLAQRVGEVADALVTELRSRKGLSISFC